jgi:aspartate-semialdehyde dehydrogenase
MRVAIVGASGAVGQEFLQILDERNFPLDELVLFGSSRSAGNKYSFGGKSLVVKELKHGSDFKDIDIAFTSAGAGISKEYASTITKYGAIMIDNSSAFRYDDDVPLIVPEVNPEDSKIRPLNIIANPNCSSIQMVEKELSVEEVVKAMENFEGLTVLDNPAKQEYPMPLFISGKDDVYVGRIRKDIASNGFTFWCVGDQIKKGAALNAVQIAEWLIANNEVK